MSLTYIQSKNTIKKFFHAPIKIYNINTYNINIINRFNRKDLNCDNQILKKSFTCQNFSNLSNTLFFKGTIE